MMPIKLSPLPHKSPFLVHGKECSRCGLRFSAGDVTAIVPFAKVGNALLITGAGMIHWRCRRESEK